jgi:adenine-specific DNA-methyltransferase
VQQADKADRVTFTHMEPWPGRAIAAIGTFMEGEVPRRAGIFVGPQYGTVSRADLMAAGREAHEARLDALVACGFNFEAHVGEAKALGALPILKAKMNHELHMGRALKNTGTGNLFVMFGEPDITWERDAAGQIVVRLLGVDVFDPKTGRVRSMGTQEIAAWFIDTNYNEESFFVRQAYFVGANDPYAALKRALKADVDAGAWAALHRDVSRPFPAPASRRFAVKVINHFGDEVMKVFGTS